MFQSDAHRSVTSERECSHVANTIVIIIELDIILHRTDQSAGNDNDDEISYEKKLYFGFGCARSFII